MIMCFDVDDDGRGGCGGNGRDHVTMAINMTRYN